MPFSLLASSKTAVVRALSPVIRWRADAVLRVPVCRLVRFSPLFLFAISDSHITDTPTGQKYTVTAFVECLLAGIPDCHKPNFVLW